MIKPEIHWLALLLLAQPVAAEVTLAPLFHDGGVLQREKPVPVWGHATAGKSVTVSFGGQTKTTTADPAGRWQISLAPMPASAESRTLSVTEAGSPALEVKDLLVGEVWLGSGQSNMEFTVKQTRKEDQDAAAASIPMMRLFQVPKTLSNTRMDTVSASWTAATPEAAKNFSAVAYFFGKKLTEELKVPVGMIHSSWGGSRIEPWWAEEGLDGIEDLAAMKKERLARSPGFSEYDKPFRQYVGSVRDWTDAAAKALDAGLPAPTMPKAPELLKLGSSAEVGTYQAMIHPLVPYALRGFLWYQGESNNGEGMLYTAKMQALIAGWRMQFKADDAPFLFVQLAPYNYGESKNTDLPGIWWAQQETLKIPHTGMAVTNDIGNPKDIHPNNKGDVARRLALWALADTYGKTDLVKSGPLFARYKVTDSGIAIAFDHTGGGLATRDSKPPTLFEIAGIDENYQPADATISNDGKTLFLTSDKVPKPDRARFAWLQTAEPNLINKEGLPAAAFNTHWPVDPTLGHKVSGGKPYQSSNPNTHGWDSGVTDGIWGNSSPTCYATDETPDFPKTVTVDLGTVQTIHAVGYGTPQIGATKTVAVSISEDGRNFTEVGRNEFPAKKATGARARFEPTKARFVRATFVDHYSQQDNYSENFGFLSELEAYAP
ncbi:MAG: sialate O-acetylesterase [Verrucomicrobiota bacterium]